MAQRGKLAAIYVSSNDGTTWTKIGGRLTGSAPTTTDTIDTTNADSEDFKEFILGDTSQTLEFSFHWEEDDPGQQELVEAVYPESGDRPDLKWRWMFKEAAGAHQWEAPGVITNFSPSADDVTQCSCTVQISEKPVRSVQEPEI